jgi:hypothetical protein
LHNVISVLVNESLFHEERTGSEWDEYITRFSKDSIKKDSKLANLSKNIETKTKQVLDKALGFVQKSVKKGVKIKSQGYKKDEARGKSYMPFSAFVGNVEIGPLYLYIHNGIPKLEISDEAKVGMTKADPEAVKNFRAELLMIQEKTLDHMEDLVKAIDSRDSYLSKIEQEVDKTLAELSPLQLNLLKKLVGEKYRKV